MSGTPIVPIKRNPAVPLVAKDRTTHVVHQGYRRGEKGEKGEKGDASELGTTIFYQTNPASVWVVQHNLNRYPATTVMDSAGDIVWGDLHHVDSNQLTLTFAAPFSGTVLMV